MSPSSSRSRFLENTEWSQGLDNARDYAGVWKVHLIDSAPALGQHLAMRQVNDAKALPEIFEVDRTSGRTAFFEWGICAFIA
jgi:hypothetical protein